MRNSLARWRALAGALAALAALAAGCGGAEGETGGGEDATPGGDVTQTPDGATDAGVDGGKDGGPVTADAGPVDTSHPPDTSYPTDTSFPPDASVDAADSGADVGAETDAGTDAGSDGGSDAGTEPATLAFFKHPKATPAGDPIPQVEVVIRDGRGRVVVDATNPVTLAMGSNPSGGILSGTLTSNPASGVAGFGDLSIDKPGTGYTLLASSPGLTGAESRAFDVGAGAPAGLAFVTQPSNAAAGAPIAPAVEVAIRDAGGNTVTTATDDVEVSLDANPGGGALAGTFKTKAVAGVATFSNLSIDKVAQGYSLKAASGTLAGAVSATFDVGPGPSARLAYLNWFPQTAAGQPISPPIRVAIQDAQGNTVTGARDEVTIALGTNPAGGVLSGTLAVAAQDGVAEFDDISIDKAGAGYTVKASSGALAETEGPAFTITGGTATRLVFSVGPTASVAGAAIAPAVKVSAEDEFGNVADAFTDSVTVTLSANPGGGSLSGTKSVAASAGVATFADLSVDKAAAGYALAAASGALSGATSGAFDVSPAAPSATVSTVAAAPSPLTADGTSVSTITVTVRDAFGNAVPGRSVSLSSSGSANSIVQPASPTNVSGVATGTIASTKAEQKTLGAVVDPGAGQVALTETAAVTFTAGAPSASVSTASVAPSSLTANGTAVATVTVTIMDTNGNPVPGATVELSSTGTANTIVQPVSPTNGPGVTTGTIASTKAEQKTLSAVVNPGAGQIALAETPLVTFVPGPAATLGFTVQPVNSTAGSSINPAVQVTVQDAFFNAVPGATDVISISIGNNPAGGTLSGTAVAAAQNGVAAFSNLSINKAGVGYKLAAAAAGLTGTMSPAFDINAGNAVRLGFAVSPSSEKAGDQISPSVQVAVQDLFGNTVPGRTDAVTVSFWTNPTGATLLGTKTVNAADGYAVFNDLSITKAGIGYSFAASSGTLAGASSDLFDISHADPSQVSFKAQPTDAVAGAAVNPAIEVSLFDQFGNLASTAINEVMLSIATGPGGAVLSGGGFRPPLSGVASFAAASLDKTGAYTLRATAQGVAPTAVSTSFGVSPADAASLQITGAPATITAGVAFGMTVTAKDPFGNVATGYTGEVGFATSSTLKVLPPDYTFTAGDAGVHAFAGIELRTAGAQGVTVTDKAAPALTATAPVTVNPDVVAELVFTNQPSDVKVDASISPEVVVTARDQFGNTDTNFTLDVTISLNAASPPGALDGTTTVAPLNGVATFADLSVDATGEGFALDADAGALSTATSDAFTVFDTPAPGDIIISEVMHSASVVPINGRWFELHNLSARLLNLGGVLFEETAAPASFALPSSPGIYVHPGEYFVMAATEDPGQNGGVPARYGWPGEFSLAAQDTLKLSFGGSVIDELTWDAAFPQALGKAMNLSSQALSPAPGHTKPWYWCDAIAVYGDGDFGTPASANHNCGAVVTPPIDWCSIQYPDTIATLDIGEDVDVFGRAYEPEGTTRNQEGNDLYPFVRGELGWGPAGTDPSDPGAGWTWVAAAYNSGYNTGSPGFAANDDEFIANMNPGAVGSYEYAFRLWLLDPVTHAPGPQVYCDQTTIADPPAGGTYGTVDVVPRIDSTSHPLVPRGSAFTVAGQGFAGTTAVTIGGQAQTFVVDSDTQITVAPVHAATALGNESVVVDAGGLASAGYDVTVMTLTIDYPVIAHGAKLVATASGGLTGSTGILVAGQAQTFVVDTDTQITISSLDATAPVGRYGLRIDTPAGQTAPIPVAVVHLAINELDSDTPSLPVNDDHEFIELSTGVDGVALDGYVLVWWNGTGDVSYRAIDLTAATDANGLLLLGTASVIPLPAIQWPNNTLQNGPDAVAIYQGTAADFPNGTPVVGVTAPLIDALVYETSDPDDLELLDALLGSGPERMQVNEDQGSNGDVNSVRRCGPALRDGREFSVAAPTPGAPNGCP